MYISVYICCLYIFKLIERKTKVKQKKKISLFEVKKDHNKLQTSTYHRWVEATFRYKIKGSIHSDV